MILLSGLQLTYRVMVATTGWPAPTLIDFRNTAEQWEFDLLGNSYHLNKEEIQALLQEGLEKLWSATNSVYSRLRG